jgi:hypothetical protein
VPKSRKGLTEGSRLKILKRDTCFGFGSFSFFFPFALLFEFATCTPFSRWRQDEYVSQFENIMKTSHHMWLYPIMEMRGMKSR